MLGATSTGSVAVASGLLGSATWIGVDVAAGGGMGIGVGEGGMRGVSDGCTSGTVVGIFSGIAEGVALGGCSAGKRANPVTVLEGSLASRVDVSRVVGFRMGPSRTKPMTAATTIPTGTATKMPSVLMRSIRAPQILQESQGSRRSHAQQPGASNLYMQVGSLQPCSMWPTEVKSTVPGCSSPVWSPNVYSRIPKPAYQMGHQRIHHERDKELIASRRIDLALLGRTTHIRSGSAASTPDPPAPLQEPRRACQIPASDSPQAGIPPKARCRSFCQRACLEHGPHVFLPADCAFSSKIWSNPRPSAHNRGPESSQVSPSGSP